MSAFLCEKMLRMRRFKGRDRIIWFLLRQSGQSVRSVYGPKMRARPDDLTNWLALSGAYGNELTQLIAAMPNDGVFVDIGANIGIYSLVAGMHLTKGTVFTFEPNPLVFEQLLENIRLNDLRNIVPMNVAIGTSTGLVPLTFRPTHTGMAHIGGQSEEGLMERTIVTLQASQLNFLEAAFANRFVLCKIDTEGFEYEVVSALADAKLLSRIDVLFVEIDAEHLRRYGHEDAAIYKLLDEHGFYAEIGLQVGQHYDEVFRRRG